MLFLTLRLNPNVAQCKANLFGNPAWKAHEMPHMKHSNFSAKVIRFQHSIEVEFFNVFLTLYSPYVTKHAIHPSAFFARYASFDYEEGEYREADLVRLDILAHGKVVDALARLTHKVRDVHLCVCVCV